MSTNIDRDMRLTVLVLSTPTTDDGPLNCAFRRVSRALSLSGDLYKVASSLGYNEGEALGIMRGWSRAAGGGVLDVEYARRIEGRCVDDIDITRGEHLGAILHARAWA